MTVERLGIAIVGCGAIARVNAEAIRTSSFARLAYAVDANPEAAEAFGRRYSVPFTRDLGEALANPGVEAVFICTPHYLHAPLAVQAAKAGKHVIVEKPMGRNVADGEKIVSACREAGVALTVCYCMRYWNVIREARKFIEAGGIGDLMGVEIAMLRDRSEKMSRRDTWQEGSADWHGVKAKSGGGMFLDNFSHYLDYLRFLTGREMEWITARTETRIIPAEVEDSFMALGGFDNRASGIFIAGSAIRGAGTEDNPPIVNSLQRIWGEHGQVILHPEPALFSLKRIGGYAPNRWHRFKRKAGSTGAGVKERQMFIDEFVRAVREGKEPPITGADGMKVLSVVAAAYRSAASGQREKCIEQKTEG
jgi:predicted dehydrogenase